MEPIIETERLILRKFNINDFKSVYKFGSDKEVNKYTGDDLVESEDKAKDIINNVWYEDYKNYGYGRWATIYKPDNKLIGFTGLKFIPELGETDIGFRYLSDYWGKGIATEASLKVIEYGFKNFNLHRIVGIAMPENIGSCRVLEKIGLKFYKKDDYDGDGKLYNWYKIEKGK